MTSESQKNPSCVLHDGGGSFYYENRGIPTLQSDRDVIVRVVATGLCGSDIHYWQHGALGRYIVDHEILLGHESSGEVVSAGTVAQESYNLQPGNRVALEPGIACNTCPPCRAGRYNLCHSMSFAATPPVDGTLCKYYRVPAECCFKLPGHISLRDGALVEPLSVAVHACRLGGDMQDKSVVVFGAGPVGLLCAAVAKAFGAATVVVVDVVESRLASAVKYGGATHTYQMVTTASPEENASALLATAGLEGGVGGVGGGADVALEATGAEPCVNTAVNTILPGGTFVQVGMGKSNISFPLGQICDKELVVKGCFRYAHGDFKLAIGLLNSHRVDLAGVVTHEFPFSQVEDAFKNVVGRSGIKTVIYGPDVDENMAKATHV